MDRLLFTEDVDRLGGGMRPGPVDGSRGLVLAREHITVGPENVQRTAPVAYHLEGEHGSPVVGAVEAAHGRGAAEVPGQQCEGVCGGPSAGHPPVLVVHECQLAEEEPHEVEPIAVVRDLRRQVPAGGPGDPRSEGENIARDDLPLIDTVPLRRQFRGAALEEHLDLGRKVGHPGVEGAHRPAVRRLGGPRAGTVVGALTGVRSHGSAGAGVGEGRHHGLLEHPLCLGEFEEGRPVVLAGHDGSFVTVAAHHPPYGLHLLRDRPRNAVEVDREQVEGVPSVLDEMVEEPAGVAVGWTREDVVPTAAEHHCGLRVAGADRTVEDGQVLDVFRGGARPEQTGVARLVVALPVVDAATAVADQRPHEPFVLLEILGR
ncbi:hypothetical protein [Streptomyces sp. NRRL F-5122]|uniref:hypothetical protein n=1 Tax=Streptomyces sp. NRRL F-5122 TaxID=1609098 RepID=UPI001F2C1845|nr:hypothetical protein [Streptomyces sp. NRRL F-5122]